MSYKEILVKCYNIKYQTYPVSAQHLNVDPYCLSPMNSDFQSFVHMLHAIPLPNKS